MDLSNYQANAIKKIYGKDSWINNDNTTIDDVIKFYTANHEFSNTIEVPDMIKTQSGIHGLTKYPLKKTRTEDLDSENTYEISYIKINEDIINAKIAYYKLLMSKDIEWEKAYMPSFNNIKKLNLGEVDYEKLSIEYEDGKPKIASETMTEEFNFDREVSPYISNTYDLLNIIDYLLYKIKAIYFILKVVKDQYTTLSALNSINQNNS